MSGKKQRPREPALGRIELVAPAEWIAKLDAVAETIGLSRSAFIRFACNRQMEREQEEPDQQQEK